MARKKKIRTIQVTAREWFDKTYGNSYFSAVICINGEEVVKLPFQYGYDDHYIDMAGEKLNELGRIDLPKTWSLWSYCQENKIILMTSKHRTLKRECIAFVA